jgi:solute carrier family 35 (UDP-sugar transporter), member A1/2/3
MIMSDDGDKIRRYGFWNSWTLQTWIPIVSNASGGILSGLFQARNGSGISSEQIVGGVLAGVSLWMHSSFPP